MPEPPPAMALNICQRSHKAPATMQRQGLIFQLSGSIKLDPQARIQQDAPKGKRRRGKQKNSTMQPKAFPDKKLRNTHHYVVEENNTARIKVIRKI